MAHRPLATLLVAVAAASALLVGGAAPAAAASGPEQAPGRHALDDATHRHDALKLTPGGGMPAPRASASASAGSVPGPMLREVFGFAPYWALSRSSSWNCWKSK